jgi:hypothetical protein
MDYATKVGLLSHRCRAMLAQIEDMRRRADLVRIRGGRQNRRRIASIKRRLAWLRFRMRLALFVLEWLDPR